MRITIGIIMSIVLVCMSIACEAPARQEAELEAALLGQVVQQTNQSESVQAPISDANKTVVHAAIAAMELISVVSTLLVKFLHDDTDWFSDSNWCADPQAQVMVGDFNGDRRADLLCNDPRNGKRWIDFADANGHFDGASDVYYPGPFCSHSTAKLMLGDFDGDRKTDLLCFDTHDGQKWIDYASDGIRGSNWYYNNGFCSHSTASLRLGDFDGDGRTDLLCFDTRDGQKWIDLASNGFYGSQIYSSINFCTHGGAVLELADMNQDGRTDLICRDHHGNNWIDLAAYNATFWGTDHYKQSGYCTHLGTQLDYMYFPGDQPNTRRAHQLCSDGEGKRWIRTSNPNGSLSDRVDVADSRWCARNTHPSARLLLGDFDGNGLDDLLCFDTNNGNKWMINNAIQ